MRPLAIDTNAYSAFKRGDEGIIAALKQAPQIIVPATVLGELLGGFAAGTKERENRSDLTLFLGSPRLKQVPSTGITADFYALVYAALRRQGRPIPTNDIWIAASCLEHGVALLTLDSHFSYVGGLRSGSRLEDFLP